MERLTDKTRNFDGKASSPKSLVIEEGMRKGMPSAYCSAIVTKLADYEDAEEQGLLLKLPCKVGDTVYLIYPEWNEKEKMMERVVYPFLVKSLDWIVEQEKHIGKSVFLTYEEAELELANRQQSHAEAIMDERNGR